MTCKEVMAELQKMGSPSIKNIFFNHGAKEPLFGVKVGDLKKLQKKIKKNHSLSLQLFDTGNSDAQYLAGLIADEKQISKKDLQHWIKKASWHMQCEYTVPWVAAESAYGFELAMEWIDDKSEAIQSAGWSTLSSIASITPDDQIDLKKWKALMTRVEEEINKAPNRCRYAMNQFIIASGCFIAPLKEEAIAIGERIGKVTVDMGNTDCKVPHIPDYIKKLEAMGRIGRKKKTARC